MLNQSQTPILTALQEWAQRPHAPFYTPGHKRGQGSPAALRELVGADVLRVDLPELPGLDNLFAPEAVIQSAQVLAAEAFGAEETWFLVNGSTCGIEAAILAVCQPGDKIILPRNVHRAAISGLILSGAVPIFVQPDYDPAWDLAHSVSPASVATAIAAHPDAKAVLLVSPTYYGVCGDMGAIATLVHQHGIPLLVDEAHGPHFGFHPDLPVSALAAGADLAVQSTHKVLSALTQAAMLHVQGSLIDRDRLSQSLQLVQSTSPSYLLLASLDAARQQMALDGKTLMAQTLQLAEAARSQIQKIPDLAVFGPEHLEKFPGAFALDPTRLTVGVAGLGITGFAADELLHETLGVTAELPTLRHLTFIISLGNIPADIDRLVDGFRGLKKRGEALFNSTLRGQSDLQGIKNCPTNDSNAHRPSPPPLSPRTAFFSPSQALPLIESIGHISTELVCPYPPGIPVLLPGETVTAEAIATLQTVLASGGIVTGCADPDLQTLRVVRQ